MSKKRTPQPEKTESLFKQLQEETIHGIVAIICFVLAIFFTLAPFHLGGPVGEDIFNFFWYLFGIGYFLVPFVFVIVGISFVRFLKQKVGVMQSVSGGIFLLSSLGLLNILFDNQVGVVGYAVSSQLIKLFDVYASSIFLFALILISLIVIFDAHLLNPQWWKFLLKKNIFSRTNELDEAGQTDTVEVDSSLDQLKGIPQEEEVEVIKLSAESKEALAQKEVPDKKGKEDKDLDTTSTDDFAVSMPQKMPAVELKPFTPLPISLLENDRGKPGVGDIKANANIIKRTLQNFGISVEMDEVSIGPSITRYALKPAEGVKLSRIIGLQNDLSLALAAHPIRIEAPIPGKSLVGIEIPNNTKTTVGLGTLVADKEYQSSEKPLLVALGKGISGKGHFGNLAKMPHLLIAGATGSGKSVTIHTIITSLLYRNTPQDLKFIMIDPKRVELTLYNKIPHLLTPVITDAKKAILSLKWAAKEMDRRYDVLQQESVRDIESYHKTVVAPALAKIDPKNPDPTIPVPEQMPYIVVIIDELADIMQTYPRELEAGIVRLAQMSRAVGIHLILSTQRPSVNVITGLIKANVPARIALQVASQIDSRTILDMAGAEKLLGAGDMLYLGSEMSQPQRIQSAYISETELKKVVKFLIDNNEEIPEAGIDLTNEPKEKNSIFSASLDEEELGEDDDLYEEAREEVIKAGKASTSYIQRKLRVGYARAARLMDLLEERGVIGPADGARPREVIVDKPSDGASSEQTQ